MKMASILARIPFGPINNIAQTFAHPQVIARESTVEVDVSVSLVQRACRAGTQFFGQHPRAGKIRMVAPPVTYNGKRMPVRRAPPWLSQHTTEVCPPHAYLIGTASNVRL